MKILILLKRWKGGIGTYVLEVSNELKKQGHHVDVISREDDLKKFSVWGSVSVLRKKVTDMMKKEKYDILYTQDWSLALPFFFPIPIFRKKHFCGFGGIQVGKASLLQKIVGKLLGKNLISYGDPVKKAFPLSKQIFNGVNLEKFKPIKKIKRIKNSVGMVNMPTEVWHISALKSATKKAGKKFFNIWGVPQKEMPKFYNKIETFVSLPPKHTGFNLCWLEAMACGVPKIIGSNAGIGCRLPIDKIENYKNIEDALKKVKKKDYRKIIEEKFSWEIHVKKLVNFFKESLQKEL